MVGFEFGFGFGFDSVCGFEFEFDPVIISIVSICCRRTKIKTTIDIINTRPLATIEITSTIIVLTSRVCCVSFFVFYTMNMDVFGFDSVCGFVVSEIGLTVTCVIQ
jgi:hypothetical protein